jgi:hypothetical protein
MLFSWSSRQHVDFNSNFSMLVVDMSPNRILCQVEELSIRPPRPREKKKLSPLLPIRQLSRGLTTTCVV